MKKKLGRIPYVYPIPIVLVGANVNGRPNYAEIGDCAVMAVQAALVTVSLHEDHYTTKGIVENGTYSVNVPSTRLLSLADYCGLVSGHRVDKSRLFETFYGELGTAPMAAECPVNLECRVVGTLAVGKRHLFVGEVVEAHVDEEWVSEEGGRRAIADLTRLDPILYALDNRYYSVGKPIGVGYAEGEGLGREGRQGQTGERAARP